MKFLIEECYSGKQQRQSVPHSLAQESIQPFLEDLMTKSEPWRAMKLVVLGNGQIGKTTMLHSLKQLVQTSEGSKVREPTSKFNSSGILKF